MKNPSSSLILGVIWCWGWKSISHLCPKVFATNFGSHLIFGTQNREEKGDPCFGFCSMVFLLFSLSQQKKTQKERVQVNSHTSGFFLNHSLRLKVWFYFPNLGDKCKSKPIHCLGCIFFKSVRVLEGGASSPQKQKKNRENTDDTVDGWNPLKSSSFCRVLYIPGFDRDSYTLLGTNISHRSRHFWVDDLPNFPRWDMWSFLGGYHKCML